LPWQAFKVIPIFMGKSIKVRPKKRGRPATGKDPLYALRVPDALMQEVDRWGKQHEARSRSEAIRQLLELGLSNRLSG
jgi:hypothetical protein